MPSGKVAAQEREESAPVSHFVQTSASEILSLTLSAV
jgi:hypothetical protein